MLYGLLYHHGESGVFAGWVKNIDRIVQSMFFTRTRQRDQRTLAPTGSRVGVLEVGSVASSQQSLRR